MKISKFELLFQKAGKRTLLRWSGFDGGHVQPMPKEVPNLIYCYKKTKDPQDSILLVIGTEDHITSLKDMTSDTKIYMFRLPNTTYRNVNARAFHAVCMENCHVNIKDVQDAAKYFLNSGFYCDIDFNKTQLKVWGTTGEDVTILTFGELCQVLRSGGKPNKK